MAGYINEYGIIDLTDAILAIKAVSNNTLPVKIFKVADINGDGLIGIEEALQALQVTSGVKTQP